MKLNIALATGGLPFTGDSLDKMSLGGSETAFIQMAKALARRGHRVSAFCNCSSPMESDGVAFTDIHDFGPHASQINYDVIIVSRWSEFLRIPGLAGLRVFWGHDTLADRNRFMSGFVTSDLCMLLSDFHIQNYEKDVEQVRDFTWKTRNGIDYDLVQRNIRPKVRNRVIYTSRPERGLFYLLGDIFPKLLERIPDLQLHFANYDLQGMTIPKQIEEHIQMSYDLAKQFPNNVHPLGHLTKAQLYQEISSSELLLYPTGFAEISCITALEAMACGTPIITTNDFALPETVGEKGGVLIDGLPTSETYVNNFAAATIELLQDKSRRLQMSREAQASVLERGYTWDAIAKEWEEKFFLMMEERFTRLKPKVLQNLVRSEDLSMAKIIARKYGMQTEEKEIADQIQQVVENPFVPQSTQDVKDLYKHRVDVYRIITEMLVKTGTKVDTFTDYQCGFAPFGVVLKKAFPNAQVFFEDANPQVCTNVSAIMERSGTTNWTVDASEQPVDLLYLGNALQTQHDPQSFLQKVSKKVKSDGHILFLADVGPSAQVYKNRPAAKRIWNFLYSDFVEIFQDNQSFKAVFVQSSKPEDYEVQGTWIVLVTPQTSYGKINVDRRRLTTRPYRSISACMIAHNEEENIVGSLKSLRGIVDEIWVADNSSPGDPTPKLAEEYGAKVFKIEFDNFAQARNESVSKATGDWILWMDADERLVDGKQLRKYLTGSVYEGFSLKQVHLTVDDMNQHHDIPVRLYQNKPKYKFTGLIHEQIEDISITPYDTAVGPSLLIPDVNLAHFGYINESKRRTKASSRNLKLLLREAVEIPERKLTKVLLLRDCLNFIKWRTEVTKEAKERTLEHDVCQAAVSLYLRYFRYEESKYTKLAEPMYQDILRAMGMVGFTYGKNPKPPYEVMFGLAQAFGGLSREIKETLQPRSFWVIDEYDFMAQVMDECQRLLHQTDAQVILAPIDEDCLPKPIATDEQIVQILSHALNMFP